MIRRWIRRHIPSADGLQKKWWAKPFAHILSHPSLWSLNRRSVSGGVAVGLFCGLIPGPLQMLGSTIAAMVFKINLPVALVVTIYTNPLTIVPLYLVALNLGEWIVGHNGGAPPPNLPMWDWHALWVSTIDLSHWMVDMGSTLFIGLIALASILAVSGYTITRLSYAIALRWVWFRRKKSITKFKPTLR